MTVGLFQHGTGRGGASGSRRNALRAIAGGLLLTTAGAACDGKAARRPGAGGRLTTPSAGQATGTIAPVDVAAEAMGRPGGTLTYAAASNPAGYDLVTQNSTAIATFISLACSGLLAPRNGVAAFPDPADTMLAPDLAAAQPEQPDPARYIFRLRSDVFWQQAAPLNGRALTASDVKWHFDRALQDKGSALKRAFAAIDTVEAPDERTVSMTMKAPSAAFLPLVAGGAQRFILARELGEAGKLRSQLTGTGPFVLERHEQNVGATFRRNPRYFMNGPAGGTAGSAAGKDMAGAGLPYADTVEYLLLPDAASRMQALQSRRASISAELNPEEWATLRASNANDFTVAEAPGISGHLFMRLDQPPFNDQRVRQALSLAIDRPAIVQAPGRGRGVPDLPVPVVLRGQSLPLDRLGAVARFYTRDVQAAKQLLAAAGYGDGLQSTLTYTGIYGPAHVQTVQLLAAALQEAGIALTLRPLDYAAYLAAAFRSDRTLDGLAYGPRDLYADADPYLSAAYLPGAFGAQQAGDATLLALIGRQQQTLDPGARNAVLGEIQGHLSEQQYRVYDVAIPRGFAWQKQVRNYRPGGWGTLSHLQSAWIMP